MISLSNLSFKIFKNQKICLDSFDIYGVMILYTSRATKAISKLITCESRSSGTMAVISILLHVYTIYDFKLNI